MMIYFQRVMLPAITAPVMRDVVDPRLLYSWELIAKPEGSTPTDVKLWRLEQPLPTCPWEAPTHRWLGAQLQRQGHRTGVHTGANSTPLEGPWTPLQQPYSISRRAGPQNA